MNKKELNAKVRNKLQASMTVLSKLIDDKKIPKKLIAVARKDLEGLLKLLTKS